MSTVTTSLSDSPMPRRGAAADQAPLEPRLTRAWLLGIVGSLLLIASAFLPWTYDPALLGNVTIVGYPAPVQLMAIALGLLALFMTLVRKGPLARLGRHLGSPSGLKRLGIGSLVFMLLVLVGVATSDPALLAAADPGLWIGIVGALLVAAAGFLLPVRKVRSEPHQRFAGWVEILVIVALVALVLFGAAYGLGIEDAWVFVLFLTFVFAIGAGLAGGGFFAWLSIVAAHHSRVLLLATFLAAFAFPFTQGGSNANMSIATQVIIFAATAIGLNIVVGLAGLLDLGYIAFLGAGAYVAATMSESTFATIGWHPPFLVVVLIGACFSAVLGLIIGSPTLRVSGDYLAIVTLAFGEIFRLAMNNLDGAHGPNITRGPNGIPAIPDLEFFGFNFGDTHNLLGVDIPRFANYYFLLLLLLGLITLVFSRLNDSRIGRGWIAIREDEKAAEAMGVNVFGLKLLAFAGGAFLAGLAGTVKAHHDQSVTPDQYQFLESAFLLAAVVLGGMGTIGGVLLGAVVLKLLPEKLRFFSEYRLLMFGLLLVLMMRFRPEGLVANKRHQLEFHEDDEELADEIEHVHVEKVS
ncbi:branched-chain amino acid ABC transporter permease [Arsenicicoccus sp. MKL-02]|uniref:Branched-chain amino acid ABC transporter permease n=1 Tax=Arsenicicoccus cauae TaxID=2663847 RepID=A0A6I3IPI6_9MICO|nr:branched-chain amino acid ABC transporter permease [Arsenicicoccus cauae]MTB70539.1 branched-chain amino acid ABC transporter permease [Arsenicicoccus cauae]